MTVTLITIIHHKLVLLEKNYLLKILENHKMIDVIYLILFY